MAAKKNKPGKNKTSGKGDDLWFEPLKDNVKDQENMSDYKFRDNNRRTFLIMASILAFFVFGGVLWSLYYNQNAADNGEPPLISAETEPVKTKPEDPGGMEIPHQDRLIFDRVSGEETKLEDNVQPTAEQPLGDLGVDTTIADLIKETEPKPVPAKTAATTPPPNAGNYIIQLGAFGQETGAENAWRILSERYASALNSLTRDIQRMTTSDGRTLYRLRAGYFSTEAEAERTCTSLKALGQDCLAAAR